MAKEPTNTGAGETKAKRKRSAKPKRIYLLCEGEIPAGIQFARNGDEAMDIVDAAQQRGVTMSFKRITMPAPVAKVAAAAVA